MTSILCASRLAFQGAFLAAVLVAPAALAGPSNVPFKAKLTTTEMLVTDPACPVNTGLPFNAGQTTGSGEASQLGAVTLSAKDCISSGQGTFTFGNGRFTLVAANGDTLTATYSGALQPTAANSPVYKIQGNYTISGGTGRFSDASGAGTLQGTQNIQSGRAEYRLSGTLSY